MKWREKAIDLAKEFPGVLRNPKAPPTELPEIFQPIDRKANDSLKSFERAALTYNPFRIEELLSTFLLRLEFCLQARENANVLDNEAFRETTDLALRRKLFAAAETQLAWARTAEPKFIRNQTKLTRTDSTIEGSAQSDATNASWATYFDGQAAQLKAMADEIDARTLRLTEPMGAGALYERREQIQKVFTIDLAEAYQQARALSLGLKHVYGEQLAVPAISAANFLDELRIWAKTFEEKFTKKLEITRFGTVLIPFHRSDEGTGPPIRLMPYKTYEKQRGANNCSFELTPAQLKALGLGESARLRGLDIWHTLNDPSAAPAPYASEVVFRGFAQPPEQPREVAPFNSGLGVSLPPIRHLALLDPDVFSPRHLHNISVTGKWTIELDSASARGEPLTSCLNLFLRLRVMWQVA